MYVYMYGTKKDEKRLLKILETNELIPAEIAKNTLGL